MSPSVIAGLWGLGGAFPYAVTRLATALWSSAETQPHQRKMACALFIVALVVGPVLAAGLGPSLALVFTVSLPAASIAVGMLANGLWPVLSDRRWVGSVLANILAGLGGWLLKASRNARDSE